MLVRTQSHDSLDKIKQQPAEKVALHFRTDDPSTPAISMAYTKSRSPRPIFGGTAGLLRSPRHLI
jgi:hypothetical protein